MSLSAASPSPSLAPAAALPLPESVAAKAALVAAASLFVALCAHASVPLPFTPVPLTFGNLAVVLVGLALGPELAFAALLLYLAEGAAGAPFFNPGGPGGLAQLFGATGGFLLAYPFAAALAGTLVRRLRRLGVSPFRSALAASAGSTALVLTAGALWLGLLLHLTARSTFLLATAPFLPGEIVKILAAAGLDSTFLRLRTRSH